MTSPTLPEPAPASNADDARPGTTPEGGAGVTPVTPPLSGLLESERLRIRNSVLALLNSLDAPGISHAGLATVISHAVTPTVAAIRDEAVTQARAEIHARREALIRNALSP